MGTWQGRELDELELTSPRLLLRPWRAADAPAVAAIMADPRISEYLPLPRPYTEQAAVEFVTGFARAGRAEGSRLECAITERDGGRLVGAAALHLPIGRVEPEIGYWLGAAGWGRGYATEAVHALAEFGFAAGLPRIRIAADVRNVDSARVALRAGFAFEGVARAGIASQDGPADAAVFARLAGDPGTAIVPSWPVLPVLDDGVVALRPLRPADWPVVHAENTNAASQEWGFGTRFSEEVARARSRCAGLTWLTGASADMVVRESGTGTPAGVITARREGPPGVVGIGYGILPEFRGRRFTSRALELLAEWLFEHTSTVRLELGCKTGNVASARSAERAGFVAEGVSTSRLRNPDGSYSDELVFARIKRAG